MQGRRRAHVAWARSAGVLADANPVSSDGQALGRRECSAVPGLRPRVGVSHGPL